MFIENLFDGSLPSIFLRNANCFYCLEVCFCSIVINNEDHFMYVVEMQGPTKDPVFSISLRVIVLFMTYYTTLF